MKKYFQYLFMLFFLPITTEAISIGISDTLDHKIENFGVREGLSQGFVLGIIQDNEGYMWFTTKDGLNRWDGYHMTVFRKIPGDTTSLEDNFVSSIFEDKQGRFWVGTISKGLFLFDKKNNRFYKVGQRYFENDNVVKIECRNDKLFIQTFSNTFLIDVSKVKTGDFSAENLGHLNVLFQKNKYFKEHQLNDTLEIPLISLLMGDREMIFLTDKKIVTVNSDPGFSTWKYKTFKFAPNIITQISRLGFFSSINNDKCYLASGNKIYQFDPTQQKLIEFAAFDPNDLSIGNSIFVDNHKILLGTNYGNFLFNTTDRSLYYLKSANSSGYTLLNNSCIDRNGTSWIGTANAMGIIKFDEEKTRFITSPIDAHCYAKLTTDKVLLANRGTIKVYNVKSHQTYYDPEISESDINSGPCLVTYSDNLIFTCRQKYLVQRCLMSAIDLKSKKKYSSLFDMSGSISRLFIDKSGRLFAVFYNYDGSNWLIEFDKFDLHVVQRIKIPSVPKGVSYPFVSSSYLRKNGELWLGTLQGLYRFLPDEKDEMKRWKRFNSNSKNTRSLSEDVIFSLLEDPFEPEKYLWVGTNGGGLNRFEYSTGEFDHFTVENGLPNNVIYGILSDKEGNLWLSTNRGLCKFNPHQGVIRTFTEADGIANDEFNRDLFLKVSNDVFLFGGINGLTQFNPSDLNIKSPPSNIIFTNLFLYNRWVDFKKDSDILKSPIQYAQSITIPAGVTMFTLEYAVMDMSSPGQKEYKYMLEGFDNTWIESKSTNSATYTNISPGTYKFIVNGTNNDGVWCASPAIIEITVLPHWWNTWWFKSLIVLVAGGLIYAFYRYRVNQLIGIQNIRNNIASDLHDEIGSTLSSIALYCESASRLIPPDSPAKNVIQRISQSTSSTLESMSDIVWAINTRNDQFDNLINRMNVYTYEVMEAAGVDIHFKMQPDTQISYFQMESRKNIYLIYKEIIANVHKHSQCKNLWVDAELDAGKFILRIKDDGIGFQADHLMNYKDFGNLGGNGLVNIFKRADELNAKIKLTSAPGEGTIWELELKL